MDLRTKREKILLKSEQSVVNPEFSPDGRSLAVQSDFEGDENYNVYVVPVTGTGVRKITDTRFDSSFPRWSSAALVARQPGTRVRLERPRLPRRGRAGPRDSRGAVARREPLGQDDARLVPGRPTHRVPREPRREHPAEVRELRRRRTRRRVAPERIRIPASLVAGRTNAVLHRIELRVAGAARRAAGNADDATHRLQPHEAPPRRTRGRKTRAVPHLRWPQHPRVAVRAGEEPLPPRGPCLAARRPGIPDRERMVRPAAAPRRPRLHDPRPELPRRHGLRTRVASDQRPRPRRRRHAGYHRRRPVAREERILSSGPTRDHRGELWRIRGRPLPRAGPRALAGRRQHRRLLQLDHRDDERARVPPAVRPTEDGSPGQGRGPLSQALADLLPGPGPRARALHRRRARPSMSRDGSEGDGRGDATNGQGRRLSRVSRRGTRAPQGLESDRVVRTRD